MKNPAKPVAPGLEVTAYIDYEAEAEDSRKEDRIIVTIDGTPLEIPLVA